MLYPEDWKIQQLEICRKYNTYWYPSPSHCISGLLSKDSSNSSFTAIRHLPQSGASGWFLWNDIFVPDQFVPVEISHLEDLDDRIIKYLGLPPGYTFSISEGSETVSFDKALLNPEVVYGVLDSRLPTIEKDGWYLEDAFTLHIFDEISGKIKEPHFLPVLKNRDIVKLNFIILTTNDDGELKLNHERMWVHLHEEKDGLYRGILDNDAACTEEIKTGMELWFSPYHVEEIYNK
jgi:hypothetical protein